MAKRNRINLERQRNKRGKGVQKRAIDAVPTTFIGYNEKDEPVCMVSEVGSDHLDEINKSNLEGFKIGDWVVSSGHSLSPIINGPYSTMQEAMDFCGNKFNVKSFNSPAITIP